MVDRALFLTGGYGVGKSAALDACGDLLASAGIPFSLFDVDWFHRSWPVAADDPDNVLLEARNIEAVWRTYRTAGERLPVVAGVLRDDEDRRRYEAALGMPLAAVLLTARPETARARLVGRYPAERADALAWHLERHETVATGLAAAGVHDAVIATDDRTPAEVARASLAVLGLP